MTITIDFKSPWFWLFALWMFYIQFAGAISVYRLALKKTLNVLNYAMFSPYLAIYFLADVIINWTILAIIYKVSMGDWLPPPGCTTMSRRFQVYHTRLLLDGTTPYPATIFEHASATFVCEKLLNPIDPTGNHC